MTKLLASSGAVVGTYNAGGNPYGVAFDGTYIWVTDLNSNNSLANGVTKLLASSGATIGTYAVGSAPLGIAFDGANMWVANEGGGSVTMIPVN